MTEILSQIRDPSPVRGWWLLKVIGWQGRRGCELAQLKAVASSVRALYQEGGKGERSNHRYDRLTMPAARGERACVID